MAPCRRTTYAGPLWFAVLAIGSSCDDGRTRDDDPRGAPTDVAFGGEMDAALDIQPSSTAFDGPPGDVRLVDAGPQMTDAHIDVASVDAPHYAAVDSSADVGFSGRSDVSPAADAAAAGDGPPPHLDAAPVPDAAVPGEACQITVVIGVGADAVRHVCGVPADEAFGCDRLIRCVCDAWKAANASISEEACGWALWVPRALVTLAEVCSFQPGSLGGVVRNPDWRGAADFVTEITATLACDDVPGSVSAVPGQ